MVLKPRFGRFLGGSKDVIFKVGPVTNYKYGGITPMSRVITPVTHLFSAIYRADFTPFITGRGPPCLGVLQT